MFADSRPGVQRVTWRHPRVREGLRFCEGWGGGGCSRPSQMRRRFRDFQSFLCERLCRSVLFLSLSEGHGVILSRFKKHTD